VDALVHRAVVLPLDKEGLFEFSDLLFGGLQFFACPGELALEGSDVIGCLRVDGLELLREHVVLFFELIVHALTAGLELIVFLSEQGQLFVALGQLYLLLSEPVPDFVVLPDLSNQILLQIFELSVLFLSLFLDLIQVSLVLVAAILHHLQLMPQIGDSIL
jgi:hypothetical protein